MCQDLVWATGYNLVAMPIAMGVVAPWGIDPSMAVGAIAMRASTIIVAANAQLLHGLHLRQPAIAAFAIQVASGRLGPRVHDGLLRPLAPRDSDPVSIMQPRLIAAFGSVVGFGILPVVPTADRLQHGL